MAPLGREEMRLEGILNATPTFVAAATLCVVGDCLFGRFLPAFRTFWPRVERARTTFDCFMAMISMDMKMDIYEKDFG
jgi:hypothetical protein